MGITGSHTRLSNWTARSPLGIRWERGRCGEHQLQRHRLVGEDTQITQPAREPEDPAGTQQRNVHALTLVTQHPGSWDQSPGLDHVRIGQAQAKTSGGQIGQPGSFHAPSTSC